MLQRRKETKNPKNIPPNVLYENCSHFWEFFRFLGVVFFDFWGSNNNFKPCHHIEFNTQNPNPIFKITISFTKTPKKPKHFRKKRNCSKYFGNFQKSTIFKNSNCYFAFSTRSIIHIFLFLKMFGKFQIIRIFIISIIFVGEFSKF